MAAHGQIRILPENLANKIAAGEVVERPASVIKELVENSLDAKARHITVIIKDGGHSLLQVVDDGAGMSRDDALLSFQRHTTSKIATDEDLAAINTFGFRGEAMASIASVARVELKTALADAASGTLVRIEGGVLNDIGETAPVPGTSIAVKNLFFNTPARRKFMKSSTAEYRRILDVMKRFTLAKPDIAFSLVNEGEVIYELQPVSLEQRIIDIMGKRNQGHLIPINDTAGLVKVTGFIGDWQLFRRSKGQQYLFLNDRYIINRSLNYALTSAYGHTLPAGQYPMYVVFLELDPAQVDVNVHPTKIEVKFAEERAIYSILHGGAKRALASDEVIPVNPGQANNLPEGRPFLPHQNQNNLNFAPDKPGSSSLPDQFSSGKSNRPAGHPRQDFMRAEWQLRRQDFSAETKPVKSFSGNNPLPDIPIEPEVVASEKTQPPTSRPFVWQLHNLYILTQMQNGLVIIDQHAAHERILFEKAMSDFQEKSPVSQQLLFPEVLELMPEDISYFKEMQPYLAQLGYEIKEFSGHTITIEAVPAGVKHAADQRMLLRILDEFRKSRSDNYDPRENVAASFACKAAIKAGEKLTLEEMVALIDQLFATQTPYFCPHGRPVIITISSEELERRFGRTK